MKDLVKRGENEEVTFYGSDDDLKALEKALSDANFEKYQDMSLKASRDIIPQSIAFFIGAGFGGIIKTFLSTRGKRMVTRENFGQKITIKGDFSVDEIERLLKIPYNINVEDDVEPHAEPHNEMGFHAEEERRNKSDENS